MDEYIFNLELQVRDYECDIQGIVNNAVYQNYLEHGRHTFLDSIGINFADLHKQGIDAVVLKTEMYYKHSLFPGDEFIIRLKVNKEGYLRFVFHQDIYRKSNNQLCLQSKAICVLISNGKPIIPTLLDNALAKHINI